MRENRVVDHEVKIQCDKHDKSRWLSDEAANNVRLDCCVIYVVTITCDAAAAATSHA